MEKKQVLSPFITKGNFIKNREFDKYYYDISEKEVFKESGEVDPDTGDKLGTIEKKFIVKKIDIVEYLNEQADLVGVESYVKSLLNQGDSIENYNTQVDPEMIVDYSKMPDTLADVMTAGDRAKAAFANMDPELKGGHTTIEGFLNDLSQAKIDAYINSRIEALVPKQSEKKEGE